jgi:hypothetical protein
VNRFLGCLFFMRVAMRYTMCVCVNNSDEQRRAAERALKKNDVARPRLFSEPNNRGIRPSMIGRWILKL